MEVILRSISMKNTTITNAIRCDSQFRLWLRAIAELVVAGNHQPLYQIEVDPAETVASFRLEFDFLGVPLPADCVIHHWKFGPKSVCKNIFRLPRVLNQTTRHL
jgi:hypothetical protein